MLAKPQLKHFLDTAYLPIDPKSASYELRYLSMKDIMLEIENYSLAFQDKPFSQFKVWCTSQKLKYLDAGVKRKVEKLETRSSLGGLYVLKNPFKDQLSESIATLPQKYREYITELKQDGFQIIGYCRKSKTKDSSNIVAPLQLMIVGLKERSLAESVYVTVSCYSNTPMSKRDRKKNEILDELSGVTGDAQDLLKNLAKI